MVDKISSADEGYIIGNLSLYPQIYDDKSDLYVATNNAESKLKQALAYNATRIILEDGSSFPDKGILRIGTTAGEMGTNELVYYETKNGQVFSDLQRGYGGSRQNRWYSETPVTSGVMSEHFNIIRDATYNVEANLGTKIKPTNDTLNDLLIHLEEKWLAPRGLFRAVPSPVGPSPLTVRFQNFSLAHSVRFFWDFGDGTTSTERSPTHIYLAEGNYTVSLDVITELGGTSVTKKMGYILVDDDQVTPFFYVLANKDTPGNLSVETAAEESIQEGVYIPPTTFDFVDQTDGKIVERYWVWDDGETTVIKDPNVHVASHIYQKPGIYDPALLIVFSSTLLKRAYLQKKITVH